jgi:heavy metal sensor kinase
MKRHSIKMKVTLWYTGIAAVILGIVFATVLIFVNKLGIAAAEEELEGAVTGFHGNFVFQENGYYPKDDTEFYDDGIMFCVYDGDGRLLYGTMPVEFPKNTVLQSHNTRVIKNGNRQWLVYDGIFSYGKEKNMWIRGITSIHNMERFSSLAIRAVAVIFPTLILLIGIIGYFMIQRALKPVDVICREADRINGGNDLTRRLPKPKAMDEIYKLTEKFNEMFDRLQSSFEHEKQFTSDVSHELRTPLAVMISQCEYLLEQEELSGEQRNQVEVLLAQNQRMAQMVSQLLMMAREEKVMAESSLEPVDFGILAEMISEEMQAIAEEKSVSIRVNADEGAFVYGNQTLLMQMMMNLLDNAVFYGKEGGYIHVDIRQDTDYVYGRVEDDGKGIEKEHLDKIWKRFYRADKSRSGDGNRTGLGLSMVKWIVSVHGGEIHVESMPGQGTTFFFQFPKKK